MDKKSIRLDQLLLYANYAFLFFIMWQCLLPVKEMADDKVLNAYILFSGLSLFSFAFRIKKYISFPLLCAYGMYTTYGEFYRDQPTLEGSWINDFLGNIKENVELLLQGSWDQYSSPFNTFSFFLILLVVTWILHVWIKKRWSILPLFVISIIYFGALEEFNAYDAKDAIVKVVLFGILLILTANMLRFIKKEHFTLTIGSAIKWAIPAILILSIGIVTGVMAPKQKAQWQDPIVAFQKLDWFEGGKGPGKGKAISQTGYGIDASKLGGDLKINNSIAFTAIDMTSHYWKVDDLSFYTGHGWKNSTTDNSKNFNSQSQETHTFYNKAPISEGLEATEMTQASMTIETDLPRLPYPYPYREVNTTIQSDKANGLSYTVDSLTNRISTVDGDSFTKATFHYKLINFNTEELEKVALKKANSYSSDMYDSRTGKLKENAVPDIYTPEAAYVQLPEGFSHRTKVLAQEITKGIESDYEKVKAIEKYLKEGQYVYSLTDVATPKENQDYVDQFLFESKKGYCDNFSSAFVILCRSLNFQTRWVRGFTGGTFQGGEAGNKTFEITNLNAHSWGEVYFNEYGWVPFEPTPGFTNDSLFKRAIEGETPSVPAISNPSTPNKKPIGPDDTVNPVKKKKTTTSTFSFLEMVQNHWKTTLALILVILLFSFALYRSRGKFMPLIWIYLYKKKEGTKSFSKAYALLLKQLDRSHLKRKPGVTLREHAKYVDQYYHTFGSMEQLTQEYEKYMYKNTDIAIDSHQWRPKWERLMRCTLNQ